MRIKLHGSHSLLEDVLENGANLSKSTESSSIANGIRMSPAKKIPKEFPSTNPPPC